MQPGASADPFPFAGLMPRAASMLTAGGDAFRERLALLQEPVAQMLPAQGDSDRQASDAQSGESAAADPGDSGTLALPPLAAPQDPTGGKGAEALLALDETAAPPPASPAPGPAAVLTVAGPAELRGRVTEALMQGRLAVAAPRPAPPEGAASARAPEIAPQLPASAEEIVNLPPLARAGTEPPRPGQPPGRLLLWAGAAHAAYSPAQGIKVADQHHTPPVLTQPGLATTSLDVFPSPVTEASKAPLSPLASASGDPATLPKPLITPSGSGQHPPMPAPGPAVPRAGDISPTAELSPLPAVPRTANAEPPAAPTLSAWRGEPRLIPVTAVKMTADPRPHPETSRLLTEAGRGPAPQADSLGRSAPPDGRSAAPLAALSLKAEAGPGLASASALPRPPAAPTPAITPPAILPDGSPPLAPMQEAPRNLDTPLRQASAPPAEGMPLPGAPAPVTKASLPLPMAAPFETPLAKQPPRLPRSDGAASVLPAHAYAPATRTPVSAAPPPADVIPLKRREGAGGDPAAPAPLLLRAEAGPAPDLPARSTSLPPAETAHRIAAQIAQRLPEPGGPGFDLRLSPEELGQVRLRLVAGDSGSLLVIYAERPDTLDLMRRHIGLLENDLRAMGHEHLSLRFAGGGQDQSGGHSPGGSNAAPAPRDGAPPRQATPEPDPAPIPAAPALPGRRDTIDLRL